MEMQSCNTCSQWKHIGKDFVHSDKICNDCFQTPGFNDDGYQLAGKWRAGPSIPTKLERKQTGITKYNRPAGSSFLRRSSVTTFGYESWQMVAKMFEALELRWEAWGGRPIALHDLLSKKKSHNLVETQINPAPLCNACCDNPARYACPSGMLQIECAEQHFACEECYKQGFNIHKGVLGGKDREYILTIIRATFQQADSDNSESLDFLQSVYFFFTLGQRLPYLNLQSGNRAVLQQLRSAYTAYVGDKEGLDVVNMKKMFKEAFRVVPTDLETIFDIHIPKGSLADFMHTLWVMYHVARPQSPYLRHLNKEEKMKQSTPEPDVEYQPEEEEPELPEVPVFVKSKCHVLQMLGQGGMSVIWLVEYAGVKMAAKVPKAGIKPRHKKDMFAAARAQGVIKHPNVLRVLGVHEEGSWPCILLELAEAGDLTEWQVGKVDLRMQWKALTEVAQGMAAIHGCNPPLIHRDLKGQNVFLTKAGTAKVADFDFVARVDPPKYAVKGICGTPGFMAPEMLAEMSYGTKADVFSYGSLLYEITHKTFPFSKELEDRSSLTMDDWFEIAGSLTLEGIRPKLNERRTCPKMLDLITRCWDGNPVERPTMPEIVSLMNELREEFIRFKPPPK
eukprot:EG_transcript_5430